MNKDSKDLMEEIINYAEKREYKMPDVWEAMGWVTTELGEVYEQLLAKKSGWVRNNPDSKAPYSPESLAEELGDVIFMVMMAGYAEGVNPLQAMKNKMTRKLERKVATGISSVIPISEEDAKKIWEAADKEEELQED
jgi:NTP pyrophosphatase (non-canonical NTP hydrolase)